MNVPAVNKIAVVTVSSDSFLPGTMVLFHSFLTHNPWFTGSLVVIDGGLSATARQTLSARFPVVYHTPNPQLEERLDVLVAALPDYAAKRTRFYSLEMFALQGYEQVLHLDSDMLCLRDVSELFTTGYAFAACPDLPWYYDCVRIQKTWATMEVSSVKPGSEEPLFTRTFNTGLLLAGVSLLQGDTYRQLLQLLVPDTFASIITGHTDSVVLNLHFQDAITWLPGAYNFFPVLTGRPELEEMAPYFVHFAGKTKPWHPNALPTTWQRAWENGVPGLS